MAEPLWAGRLSARPSDAALAFQSSFPVDQRMALQDIAGSRAHALMLGRQGIIPEPEAEALVGGLDGLAAELRSGKLAFPAFGPEYPEDVHSWVEGLLTERLGDAGKRLHTGRSRNDQVALDVRLYMRERSRALRDAIASLVGTLRSVAEREAGTVMPGYTHVQRAQPVTLGYHLACWCFMLMRDWGRLADAEKRYDLSPLGSGALAGTGFPIDRAFTASELGFSGPTENAMDSVSDRDHCTETAAAIAILMGHLSRFSEEVVLWASAEFGFVELSDAWSTGSSIMPQKKNPDYAELVRGKSGRAFGNLVALLAMQKGLPLSYDKDLQEDKEALFDSFDTAEACLAVFAPMLESAQWRRDRMRAAAEGGFANATDLADYLVAKGLPFRDAHRVSATAVRTCIAKGIALGELPLEEYRELSPLMGDDVYSFIELDACVGRRSSAGGPALSALKAQLERISAFVAHSKDQ